MSYLFDDASSNRLSRSLLSAFSMSVWFYPDDSALDCAIYAEYNALGTKYMRIFLRGASDDKVELKSSDGTTTRSVVSTGTVNYNAWNHVFAARGASSPTHAYISLNGETIVDGGVSYQAPGLMTVSALGRVGSGSHFSGMIGEMAVWDNCLSDFDDRYKMLALGFDPRLVPQDPGGTNVLGLGVMNLTSYSPLVGSPLDVVTGTSWTVTGASVATTGVTHPSMRRNLMVS